MKLSGRFLGFGLFLFLFGAVSFLAAADYYVDAEAGSDDASGETPESAWKSLDRINNAALVPGDRVLFRRRQVWRGSLNAQNGAEGNPIYYGAYGEGRNPVLLGSVDLTEPAAWTPPTADAPKIWTARPYGDAVPASNQNDIGNIILTPKGKLPADSAARFEDDTNRFAAFKRWGIDQLQEQNDFFYDGQTLTLYYYSDQNPTELFDEIEAAKKGNLVNVSRYVTLENLACGYGASHGVQGTESRGCVIRGCDFFWIGGGHLYGELSNPTRYGNGVEFWTYGEDHLVEGCRFREVYDVAMTIQGPEKTVYRNIVWRNNEIVRCCQTLEIWLSDPESAIENVVFENNRSYDAGYGWSFAQRPDKSGTHLLSYALKCKSIDVTIRDNVFSRGRTAFVMFWNERLGEFKIDHNVWIQPGIDGVAGIDRPLFRWNIDGNPVTIPYEEYRSRTGNDAHSEFQSLPAEKND